MKVARFKIRRSAGRSSGQCHNFSVKFDCLRDFIGRGRGRVVIQIEHIGAQKWTLLVQFHDFKSPLALGHDVHAAIFVVLGQL